VRGPEPCPLCFRAGGGLRFTEIQLENLKKRIQQIKERRPGYGTILDFYLKVKEEQEKTRGSLTTEPVRLKKEWSDAFTREGFSLLQKEDFPVDIEASLALFENLLQIAEEANPYMAERTRRIKEVIDSKAVDRRELFKVGVKEKKIEEIANQFSLDRKVLSFLIQNSLKPSIEATMEQARKELNPETWLKGYCPVCGSIPILSLLKEEGKRYLLCSYCGCQWRVDRLLCPFCGNNDQKSLHYLYAEEEEAYRINLCEKCRQYIKTIDLRKIEECDPPLEDLATLHLDILATQKGYKRPVTNPWIS
jgi:FdhE protein